MRVLSARERGGAPSPVAMDTLPQRAPTVPLRDIVERVIQRAHAELVALTESCTGRAEFERKAELARYAHRTRQRLVRLGVIERWAPKSGKIACVAANAHLMLRAHDEAFVKVGDGCFHLHQQLEWAKAPLWDLPGALDVLCNGTYSALPRTISDVGVTIGAKGGDGGAEVEEDEDAREARLEREARHEGEISERLVQSKMFGCDSRDDHREWPSEDFKVFAIEHGKAMVGVDGVYKATLTLGGPVAPGVKEQPRYGGWRVECIEILAGARENKNISGDVDSTGDGASSKPFELSKAEERKLADIACARMVGLPPFGTKRGDDEPPLEPEHLKGLHRVALDGVLMLSANSVLTQAQTLKESAAERSASKRWSKNDIKVEIVKGEAAGVLEGVRASFWLQSKEPGSLAVSFDTESLEMCAKVQCFGEDDTEDVAFDYSCIDVEGMLVNAIRAACTKKLQMICDDLAKEKTFKVSVESLTAEQCSCADDEDGWANDARPTISVEISKFTHLYITCRMSDGSLILHGAGELVPSAMESELSKRLALEGHAALASIVDIVSVAVEQQELKGLLRTSGTAVHPAPGTLGGDPWKTSDANPSGTAPTALVPVTPSDGGVFVATWMTTTPAFALVRAHRITPAARYTVDVVEKLDLGARKGAKAEIVAKLIAESCRDLAVDAQRAALAHELRVLKIKFVDIRTTAKGTTQKADHTVSFEIPNTSKWARSKYKRMVKSKSALTTHVALKGMDGLSARIGDETLSYDHSEFVVHAVLADVRRIAAAQGFVSAIAENASAMDFAATGCVVSRRDAFSATASYTPPKAKAPIMSCVIEWKHAGNLGPGFYAHADSLNASTLRALSLGARDGRCEVFACALRAAAAATAHFIGLADVYQLSFSAPGCMTLVKIQEDINAMRLFSAVFRLDGSISVVIGRGGDGPDATHSVDDDEMHIHDDHESLIVERVDGLVSYIDTLSTALKKASGLALSHGEFGVVEASKVDDTLDALVKAL